jgi:hypothetical protein
MNNINNELKTISLRDYQLLVSKPLVKYLLVFIVGIANFFTVEHGISAQAIINCYLLILLLPIIFISTLLYHFNDIEKGKEDGKWKALIGSFGVFFFNNSLLVIIFYTGFYGGYQNIVEFSLLGLFKSFICILLPYLSAVDLSNSTTVVKAIRKGTISIQCED